MKKCFSVLLIFVFLLQEPSLSRADYFERDAYRSRQAYMHHVTQEAVKLRDIKPDDKFHLKYYLNGGIFTTGSPTEYDAKDLPVVPESPVREGYNFAGWYTDSRFSQKISHIDADTIGSYHLYAKWTKRIDGDYNIQMYTYPNSVTNRSNKKLKNCSYEFLNNVKIPGMPSTREEDVKQNRITDSSQCLQGICLTEDYLLISSYSSGQNNTLGCIHIFDKQSGKYLASLGMKERSHLGGLAFDGTNIWVCHSNSSALECIPYQFVKQIAEIQPQSVVDCSALFQEYHVSNVPSCMVYHNGRLWVATHSKLLNSKMAAYKVTKNGLRQTDSYRIPGKVQGIAFDEENRVYISASYGRKKSSYLRVYDSVARLNENPNHPMVKIEMPPCSEEIAMADNKLYVLFESASEKYFEGTDGKGTSISPIDEVLVISKRSILK